MFNKEFISKLMDLYGCNQLAVDREGNIFAMKPEGQFPINGIRFDTDTMDGTVAQAAIARAMETQTEPIFEDTEDKRSLWEKIFGFKKD